MAGVGGAAGGDVVGVGGQGSAVDEEVKSLVSKGSLALHHLS